MMTVLPYIHVGSLKISLYYTAMFVGYAAMVFIMLLQKRRSMYRLSKVQSIVFASAVLVVSILGCKLLYVFENYRYVQKNGFTLGGFSFFGAVILAPLLMLVIGKAFKLRPGESLDNTAICGVTMLGTIRIGCFFNGCCGGRIFFFEAFDFSFPTQLMECICDFVILSWLLRMESEPVNRGRLYGRFLLSYGAVRFFLEFLRATPKDWCGLSHSQWFSTLSFIVGGALEILYWYRARDVASPTTE